MSTETFLLIVIAGAISAGLSLAIGAMTLVRIEPFLARAGLITAWIAGIILCVWYGGTNDMQRIWRYGIGAAVAAASSVFLMAALDWVKSREMETTQTEVNSTATPAPTTDHHSPSVSGAPVKDSQQPVPLTPLVPFDHAGLPNIPVADSAPKSEQAAGNTFEGGFIAAAGGHAVWMGGSHNNTFNGTHIIGSVEIHNSNGNSFPNATIDASKQAVDSIKKLRPTSEPRSPADP